MAEQKQDAPKEKKTKKTIFYWRRYGAPRFTIPRKGGDGTIIRVAKNNVMSLDGANKDDATMIDYLRAHGDNEKNDGVEFAELKSRPVGEEDASKIGEKIDELYEMDTVALSAIAGGGVASARKSKGTLIAEILKLK